VGEQPKKAQNMIDCLFLTPKGTLVFVEVKTTANKEAQGRGQSAPTVGGQLERYRKQLSSGSLREEIRNVYSGVTQTLGQILGRKDLPAPRTVFNNVPLLIVGLTSKRSPRAKEVWQHKLLSSQTSIESEIIGIDGRDERMIGALDEFFRAVDGKRAGVAIR
jgi:hypothetical protein